MSCLLKIAIVVMTVLQAAVASANQAQSPISSIEAKRERVLVIWSFPRVYPWILQVDKHFTEFAREELNQRTSGSVVVLEEENLPFQGGITAEWSSLYLEYIAEKYSDRQYDRIVTIDAAASAFMRQHGNLFNYLELYQVTQRPTTSIPNSILLKPDTDFGEAAWKQIDSTFTPNAPVTFLVSNQNSVLNETGQSIRAATNWLDPGNYILLDPAVIPLEEIRKRLTESPQGSRIIYLPVSRTTEENEVIPRQFLTRLTNGLDRPVYCSVSSFMGAGCLAGYGQSSRLFARLAASAVYDTLTPDSVNQLTEMLLDEAQLHLLGLARPAWYGQGLVVNPRLTVWEEYSDVVVVVGVLISVFALILMKLVGQSRLINKARLDAQANEQRFKYILTGTNAGTWEWNVQTGETRFNERWAEIVGLTLKELGPTNIETWSKLAHPRDMETSEQRLQDHFDGKSEFYELEARMQHKDGHWVWVLVRGQVATWTKDGKPEWMFGTHQEISKSKQLEEQLKLRTTEAENALKVKSEFLAAMSHEIRTPMNGVLGLAELGRNAPSLEKKNFYLEGISRSGKLLMGILNDVLDFSRLEAGRTKLQLESFDVEGLFGESVELFRATAESKGISLKLEVQPGTPRRLFGDPIKLSQMVNNYLGNALKFTVKGAVCLKVTGEPVNGKVRLYVECIDSGLGIPQEDVQKLFKPFSQVSRDTRVQASGTGLGLVLVLEYAKLMDGKCGVNSSPGQGSVFWFDVLLDLAEDTVSPAVAESSVDPSLLMGKHILIVDDNSMNVLILEAMLDEYHITHDTASNGVEAIRQFESSFDPGRRAYDAVLMDVQMPVMDGLEATRIIKSGKKKSPPVLALTAAVLPDEMEACKRSGMDSFVPKPIDTKRLYSELIRLTCALGVGQNN